ncbi:MAG TPA: hypothetical protein VHE80_01960 [Acidimicrobiales bacterium]|nr:hypothetical protein [Acidimicrobiales bacterium]
MSEVPAKDRLAHVVTSVVRHLPGQLHTLLACSRFDQGRAALERLGAPGGAVGAVAGVRPAEAARLTELLLERWAAVGEVVVDPAAVVLGPEEVWVSDRPRTVRFDVATIGVDDGWRAEWLSGSQEIVVPVPGDGEDIVVAVTVRVFGRVRGARDVLVGERTVRARRAVARLSPDGRRVLVEDHLGRPAATTEVAVDGPTYVTDRRGTVQLDDPLDPRAAVLVDGQRARWVT